MPPEIGYSEPSGKNLINPFSSIMLQLPYTTLFRQASFGAEAVVWVHMEILSTIWITAWEKLWMHWPTREF